MNKSKAWTAETIAIGSELLLGGRVDTNSLYIADHLPHAGLSSDTRRLSAMTCRTRGGVLKTAAAAPGW